MQSRFFTRRRTMIALGLIATAVLIHLFFSKPSPVPNAITTAAEIADLEQTVLADGNIEAQKQVSVGAQASGQIKALHVKLGDKVKKGQLIAEIDDLTQQDTLKNGEAALKNVQAQRAAKLAELRNNELSWQRQQMLMKRGVGAQADYDSAKATLDATRANIDALDAQIVQAQLTVNTAKVNLGYTQIRSPMDGTVVAIPVEAGQTVNAIQTTPTIAKVANLDTMTIKVKISEADVVKVKTGMPVWFSILGEPNKRYEATLSSIEPAPDSINTDSATTSSSTGSSSSSSSTAIYYNGQFDVQNPDGVLRISMTAQVNILLSSVKNAIVVPATALTLRNGMWYVQIVNANKKIESRLVTLGLNDNVRTQIRSGLSVGEQVVVSPSPGDVTSTHPGPPMGM
ncbi:efflux RND transporter periplasmic adaptor subunit [Pectobacterium parmentieri]|uniref:Efflux RND transporter periplasmic adaptor subunit n=1 Tax=Pectobacterium parmentieri TaxID=1905730 RepID=A0A0H3I0V2_PECPM|nr:efflux RND transporter periplasmic adaptor subunit [Pectobacterium parmentieri]AFI89018.1 Macrolide-specific efflux protein MacA [Pectobacterium parmentieri]AYH04762.1 efflux RND transporter periplasmic adaptor subunit [Pectobacterium parmentieri]AYH13583.1 efflux RND transporter periplasmic adaptor subunit [Pectobacterium parmentieri]AYH22285.1 efflux RND transporter periplasmic adaptor subunit [Pectobacterium parmentieri]MBI0470298.1 efflux RND transporter periplasmic adaptor subunit [Pec